MQTAGDTGMNAAEIHAQLAGRWPQVLEGIGIDATYLRKKKQGPCPARGGTCMQNFALGKLKRPMEPSQVTAALGLLCKALSDLQAIEHSGEIAETVLEGSAEPLTEGEWAKTHGGRGDN